MLRRFEDEGLLSRGASASDKRQNTLTLTDAGRAAFAPLDERSRQETCAMLATLPEPAQEAMVSGMDTIARILADQPDSGWLSRHHAPGDIGWGIERHGALYAEEYNFNHKFEALVAQVASAFLDNHDAARERCWIAERNGVRIGSIFLVRKTDDIGKLRLLLVEPSARGLGVGKR